MITNNKGVAMKKTKPLQFSATITKLTTMSQSIRLNIDTQQNLTDEQIGYLVSRVNKLGWFSYNVTQIENEDIINLPPLKKEAKKGSPSQRLYNKIWQYWNNIDSNMEFKDYYEWYIDQIIEKIGERLT